MEKFKYLDHTSEAKFQAFGETLEEAFANAGLAVMNIMTEINSVKPIEKKEIKIESKSKESLLYDFLNNTLYVVEVDGIFISKFENTKITQEKAFILTTTAHGDKVSNCSKGSDVKAPTYDEMKIEKTKNGWMIQVVVDV